MKWIQTEVKNMFNKLVSRGNGAFTKRSFDRITISFYKYVIIEKPYDLEIHFIPNGTPYLFLEEFMLPKRE